jgi:hypothetical protein
VRKKGPRWTDKLARTIRDAKDDVTLRTRNDARHYMAALPDDRARRAQWQAAAKLLLDGANAEPLTTAIELALTYEARLDVKLASEQS